MGNITIRIPQQVHIEYTLKNARLTGRILDLLNALFLRGDNSVKKNTQNDQLLGLFSDQADLFDQVTESALQERETSMLRAE